MRFWFCSLVVVLSLSCRENPFPGYKKIDEHYIKIHQIGEVESPSPGDIVMAELLIETINGDTIHYVPGFPYFFQINNGGIDKLFQLAHVEDSVSFIVSQKKLKDYFHFIHLSDDKESLARLNVRIKNIYSSKVVANYVQDSLMQERKKNQHDALEKIINNLNQEVESFQGIHRVVMDKVGTTSIVLGSEVSIHYRGMFTNAYVFDDSYQRGEALSFVYGKDFQVLDGISLGLKGMKEGNKVKIYISSHHGFGEKGSLSGIVPPYTSIIYEVEIIKVKNQ